MKYSEKTNRVSICENDKVYIDGKDVTENHPDRIYTEKRRSKKESLNRLICQIVNGEPTSETGKRVGYIDGNKNNIRPSNLVWQKHKFGDESNRRKAQRKLSQDQVLEIVRLLNIPMLQKEIADIFNVTPVMISFINTGKSHADITKIDKNKKFPTGGRIAAIPNGKYAVLVKRPFQVFETYEEAKNEVTRYFREEFYAK